MKFSEKQSNKILLLGNGPSLRYEYFNFLDRTFTIGMNSAFQHWERIDWYPDFYTCLDSVTALEHAQAICRMIMEGRFLGSFLHQDILRVAPQLAEHPQVLFMCQMVPGTASEQSCAQLGLKHRPNRFFQSIDDRKLTTGSYAVRYAASLGFDEIGIIGVDCRPQEMFLQARRRPELDLEAREMPLNTSDELIGGDEGDGASFASATQSGNLHLGSFQVLRADNLAFNFGLKIVNCAPESALADEDVFPFMTLPAFIGWGGVDAVIVPCMIDQIPDLVDNMKLWGIAGHRPCTIMHKTPIADLVVVMDRPPAPQAVEVLQAAFASSKGLREAFRSFLIQPVKTPDHGQEARPSVPEEASARLLCHALADALERPGCVFIMQVDTIPIRSGWLSELDRMACGRHSAWIIGSTSQNESGDERTGFIGGDTLYAADDPGFRDFFQDLLRPILNDNPGLLTSPGLLPTVVQCWRSWSHRVRSCDLVVNISTTAFAESNGLGLLSDLRRIYPTTWLTHSRTIRDILVRQALQGSVGWIEHSPEELRALDQAAANLSLATPSPLARVAPANGREQHLLITIDTDGVDNSGHHFAYNRQLARACTNIGVDNLVLGTRQAVIEPDEERWLLRTFTQKSWQIIGPADWQNQQALPLFARELQSGLLQALLVHGTKREITLYFYTGSLRIAANIFILLKAWPNLRGVVNLLWSSIRPFDAGEARWLLAEMIEANFLNGRLRLTVPTLEQQRLFFEAVGIRFDIAPHPSPAFDDAQALRLLERPLPTSALNRVRFPAAALADKGQALAAAIMQGLRRHPDTRHLDISYRCPSMKGPAINLFDHMDQLATPVSGPLSEKAFTTFLDDTDLIILPYLPDSFRHRTSGLLIDALYLHKPSLVSERTWLADIVSDYGCGRVADAQNPEAFVAGVRHLISDYPASLADTAAGARRYFANNSWNVLIRSILA